MSTEATRTYYDDLLRIVYADKVIEQWNSKHLLSQLIPRDTKPMQGQKFSVLVNTGGTPGFQFSNALELPEAGLTTQDRAEYTLRNMTDRIRIRADLFEDTASKQLADEEIFDHITSQMALGNGVDFSFQLWGDGTAKLAIPATATSAYVLTVDDTRGLRPNMAVDILLAADGTVGGGVQNATITVNHLTKTVTLSKPMADYAAVNAAPTTYYVYKRGSRNQAFLGLQAQVSASNPASGEMVGGIDRTAAGKEFWHSHILGNSGTPRAFSSVLLDEAAQRIHDNGGMGEADLCIFNPKIWRRLTEYWDKRRQLGDGPKLMGWARSLLHYGPFGDISLVADKHCPLTSAFVCTSSAWKLRQPDEGKWMDKDGSIWDRAPNTVAYEASWWRRGQLVLYPSSFARIDDLGDLAIS